MKDARAHQRAISCLSPPKQELVTRDSPRITCTRGSSRISCNRNGIHAAIALRPFLTIACCCRPCPALQVRRQGRQV